MKKVILIAYYYFQKEIIASNRTTALLKYLPEFGWDVTLITCGDKNQSQLPNIIAIPNQNPLPEIAGKILSMSGLWSSPMSMQVGSNKIEEDTNTSKKSILTTILKQIRKIPIPSPISNNLMLFLQSVYYSKIYLSGWHKKPYNAAVKLYDTNKYDAILSTYSPASAHEVASHIHKTTSLPWIADYRDLWSTNHIIHVSDRTHKKLEKHEANVIRDSRYMTTVSESLATTLSEAYNKPTYFIPNGFDPEEKGIVCPLRPKFTITYTGTLYHNKMSSILFKAIGELISENNLDDGEIDIRYYGPSVTWLDEDIRNHGLERCVKQYGVIPKEEAKEMQRSSQLLLLLGPHTEDEDGVFGGKIFEYFGASRPILALGRDSQNVVRNILNETKAGEYFSNTDELKKAICRWYEEWKVMGSVSYHGNEEEIDKYSYRAMAKKYAELLDSLT